MRYIRRILMLMRRLGGGTALERELDEELRDDIERRVDEFVHDGMTRAAARRRAQQEIGGVTQVAERCREVRAGAVLETVLHDVRFGWRTLRKNPLFMVVAVLTLAIGIGANTAIFSVVNHLLLQPLPFPGAERLVFVWTHFPEANQFRYPASGPQYVEMRDHLQTFDDLAGIWAGNGIITGADDPIQLRVGFVTSNFFEVVGATPALGRTFEPDEQGPGAANVIVISDQLWRRRFGTDQSIVGRAVQFDGRDAVIIGVMPPGHALPFPPYAKVPAHMDAWVPFADDFTAQPPDLHYLRLVGRRRPETSLAQVQSDLDAAAAHLRSTYQVMADPDLVMEVLPFKREAMADYRPALLALFGAVGVVLLLACGNVASLMMARACDRRREFAMRTALGASFGRLVRQLLSESLLLFVLAGAIGSVLALYGVDLLWSIRPSGLSEVRTIPLSTGVFMFTLGLSLVCGLAFGLVPLLEIRRLNVVAGLRDGPRVVGHAGSARFRQLLIVSEVAMGLVLLVVSALFINSLLRLQQADPGFEPERALSCRITLPPTPYADNSARTSVIESIERRIAGSGGVVAVGAISHLPLDDEPSWAGPVASRATFDRGYDSDVADHRAVTPGYFRAIGATLVAGRLFDEHDDAEARPVVVIDEALAAQLWPDRSAVGQELYTTFYENGEFDDHWATIVGVIRHIKHYNLSEQRFPQVYLPYAQCSRPQMSLVVRTEQDPLAAIDDVRRSVLAADAGLPVSKVRPMTDLVDRALTSSRFTTLLLGLFSAMALLLALIGLYGLLAYQVRQRTREFGILLALGASPGRVCAGILKRGLMLTATGLAVGIVLALGSVQLIDSLLYDVDPTDPLTFGIVIALFIAVAALACLVPARRAMRVDPMTALRIE